MGRYWHRSAPVVSGRWQLDIVEQGIFTLSRRVGRHESQSGRRRSLNFFVAVLVLVTSCGRGSRSVAPHAPRSAVPDSPALSLTTPELLGTWSLDRATTLSVMRQMPGLSRPEADYERAINRIEATAVFRPDETFSLDLSMNNRSDIRRLNEGTYRIVGADVWVTMTKLNGAPSKPATVDMAYQSNGLLGFRQFDFEAVLFLKKNRTR